jgi:acetyl-CoA carboxylase biotin carboxyl carrier protein
MPKKKTRTDKIKELTSPARLWGGKKGGAMKSDLNYIKKLIKLLNSNDVSEIEVEEGGVKVRVVKNRPASGELPHIMSYSAPVQSNNPSARESGGVSETKEVTKQESPKKALIDVRSPIVGTFYRAPSPNADSYVQVGQTVGLGTVLCIIEAMKLMNEIESEVNGKITEICVENGKPVEYNQLLFRIEPA